MESVAARMAMDTDSPNLSLRSRTTVTTDGDSYMSTSSLPCSHFLSANVINVVEKCMSSMQMGTQMVKLRGGSKGLVRFFYLDEHKSCIRWRPSRKNEKAKISVDSVREVCEGKQSEIFQRYSDGSFDPNCCFSLYYGEHMESLDLVSGTGEEARTWITGLKYLMAGISDEDSLAKRQRTRDQWLKQTFTEADKNGDSSLSIGEVMQLLHKLNVNLPRQRVKQMFKEADTDDNQGALGFEEFCSFYKMMSTRRDLYLLMITYSNHKDHLDFEDLARFLETEQKMTKVTKEHCLEIINKFEPCSENQKQGVLGIDGITNYMRSPAGDIFNPEHYGVLQDMKQPLCNYFIASSHNTYLMGDQLMSQSRVDMYAWVLQAGCRCVEVDCWDGQDGEPIVHHGYTLTSKILFKDVIETINKYAFAKNNYPVILSIENHCSVPQQKKMAQYLIEILGDKLDVSNIRAEASGRLPSPETLRGKILVKGKKLPPNIDEDAEEGDVSDEDSADEMEDDCKLMNGDTTANRKQVENLAKKKLDNLMKESKIRDREDPDSFTIAALPPAGKSTDNTGSKGKSEEGTDTGDEANPCSNKRTGRSFMGSFSKRKKKVTKLKKTSSFEDTDTDQESTSSASRAPLHHNKKKKTMKLSRALSDLVKYTCSVGLYDIEAQPSCSWQVSSLSETKAHQMMQQKATSFIHFNQRQLSRIYPSSYRVDSSNFNPQPFWSAGCQLVALNYQSEGRVLQLNRAKFYSNGNCGYILKPACMCEGTFNPNLEEPLPGQMKKQLVLKIISGQQLPKPKDSMLGDRGEIIDPFVEVEIIGLPVDCCKEQTRVVDDNGFNPMWEETIVFTVHMPELTLVRFLVWDHDPIGQDFIGQRTIAFNSMIPGYRHVYLEGMEEASIFVHVAVHDITGKARAATGIKGLFHRNPKQASLDSHAAAQHSRKHPFGAHLLRRTASAPTKGQLKVKKGFPEIAIDTKDYSSEGASEDRESEDRDKASAGVSHQPTPPQNRESLASHPAKGPWERPDTNGAFHPEKGKDCSTVQNPAPPPLHSDAARTTRVIRSVSTPEDSLSSHHSSPSPLQSTAINADHLLAAPSNGVVHSPTSVSGDPKKPTTTSRTTLLPLTPEKTEPSQVVPSNRGADSLMERSPNQKENLTEKKREAAEVKSDHRVTPAAVTEPPRPPAPERAPARRALFSSMPSHSPVRRTNSEGHVLLAVASTEQSAVPQVCTDATMNDRLWSKLDPASQRDSMSSSSSISSSDTVIDLSLPNLARKNLSSPPTAGSPCDPNWINYRHSALVSYDTPQVSKSKSNPNLQQSECPRDELKPRPLQPPEEASVDSPNRLTQRRHTWSRLYMEGLKQSSPSRPSPPAKTPVATASMSKSLGDLTSDDISCNFDSKYRSISRSFIARPLRDQFRRGSPQKSRPTSDLTEQLRKLTDVEPLTASDFAPETRPRESQEDFVDETLMRRTSSRSQSRVRYIANRAKKAQERQRLQGLAQGRSASFNLGCGSLTNPIEERGNPEGACCVAQSPCTSLDLLSQLAPLRTPSPRQPQSPPESSEVFFRLKL
ncbi:1-phosphatidylinositol 4,5-bisphosphate phosphodiesterase eta-2a isoform X2 [Pseudochaenichthys georgianus]|uniref:1-phosphatidylinositol 4,5-bisphosphate phosphodiesterase eta-2a isoform X2 n=1 Tax=Pseudochaenichthys georgianus TaxID=52239 RepID=UPI00146F7391|nr:1-phosphatidylinositol 4,5-bisphosphate phosphodiesterase eta-2a isoform X2 [Pseudochaenichthys georgianus]